MRVTLRILAKEAGVNVATASRALRGLACVDSNTRERILATAKKLGYVRDPVLASAFSLVRRSEKPVYRETIAFLAFPPKKEYKDFPWLDQIHRGACDRAEELGYNVEYQELPPSPASQRALSHQLKSRGMRGVLVCLVSPRGGAGPVTLNLDWKHFVGIQVGHPIIQPALSGVARNLPDDMDVMLREVYRRGYRRIGLAVSRQNEETRRWAVLSALLLQREFHPDLHISVMFQDEPDFTEEAFQRWLKRHRPDVLVINGTGVMGWLQKSKHRIPEDLGICRIDCIDGCQESGIKTSYLSLGRMSVNQLISILEHGASINPEAPERHCLTGIPSVWYEGSTLPPLASAEPTESTPPQ